MNLFRSYFFHTFTVILKKNMYIVVFKIYADQAATDHLFCFGVCNFVSSVLHFSGTSYCKNCSPKHTVKSNYNFYRNAFCCLLFGAMVTQ